MRQHPHSGPDQRGAVFPNRPAMRHILIGKPFRGLERQGLTFRHIRTGRHRRADLHHRVHRIHRRRTCFLQCPEHPFHVPIEPHQGGPAEFPNPLGQSIRRRCPDRPGPPDDHIPDRRGGRGVVRRQHGPEFMGQEPLFNQPHPVALPVEADGPIRTGASPNGHVHRARCYGNSDLN